MECAFSVLAIIHAQEINPVLITTLIKAVICNKIHVSYYIVINQCLIIDYLISYVQIKPVIEFDKILKNMYTYTFLPCSNLKNA